MSDKQQKYDMNSPEARALIDEIVHGTFMKEGTMVAFPTCFPGASIPIAADESHITALDITGDGIVYGGTSGRAAHLFVAMFHGVTGVVFDLGTIAGADQCVAIGCGGSRFAACVNGPGGGRVITGGLQGLPFDLIQEWGFSRPPLKDLGKVNDEPIVHACSIRPAPDWLEPPPTTSSPVTSRREQSRSPVKSPEPGASRWDRRRAFSAGMARVTFGVTAPRRVGSNAGRFLCRKVPGNKCHCTGPETANPGGSTPPTARARSFHSMKTSGSARLSAGPCSLPSGRWRSLSMDGCSAFAAMKWPRCFATSREPGRSRTSGWRFRCWNDAVMVTCSAMPSPAATARSSSGKTTTSVTCGFTSPGFSPITPGSAGRLPGSSLWKGPTKGFCRRA